MYLLLAHAKYFHFTFAAWWPWTRQRSSFKSGRMQFRFQASRFMFPPLAHRPLQALPCSTKSHFSRNKSRPESATFWKAHVHSYSRTKRWQFRAQRPEAKHHFRTLRNGTAFKFRLKLQTTAPSFTKKFVEKKITSEMHSPTFRPSASFYFT